MNTYFFDRANAVDRENRIREASAQQQEVASYTINDAPAHEGITITVISPKHVRSLAMSFMIVLFGIFLLMVVATPAEAQAFEPHGSTGEGAYSEAIYIFTMANVDYVRGNYDEALEGFTEAIDLIPTFIFENCVDFAHWYFYLAKAQIALEMDQEAMVSLTLYVEYARGEALPEVVAIVEEAQRFNADQLSEMVVVEVN